MENEVKTEIVKTTLTGTIEGKSVVINYENELGKLPTNVGATCNIPNTENPMENTNINVSVNIMGNKNIIVNGAPALGNISMILSGIESTIQGILTNPPVV